MTSPQGSAVEQAREILERPEIRAVLQEQAFHLGRLRSNADTLSLTQIDECLAGARNAQQQSFELAIAAAHAEGRAEAEQEIARLMKGQTTCLRALDSAEAELAHLRAQLKDFISHWRLSANPSDWQRADELAGLLHAETAHDRP